jgi:protein-disulfide isomerase
MDRSRQPAADSSDQARPSSVDRRRALLGAAGLVTTALAGCLGSGTSGSSGGSGNATTRSGDPLSAPVRGDPEAGVTVAVYEDFACPHCRSYNAEILPEVESEYIEPGTIRYEHRDFPLPVDDPQSYYAANAARAVQDRTGDEEFWTYADLLFENQSSLGGDRYASLADEVGVDGDPVRGAAASRVYRTTVMGNKNRGKDEGVTGTPGVIVDGNVLSGYSFDAISSAVESAR